VPDFGRRDTVQMTFVCRGRPNPGQADPANLWQDGLPPIVTVKDPNVCAPTRQVQCMATGIVPFADVHKAHYLWTLRYNEYVGDLILVQMVGIKCKWEMLLSLCDNRVVWSRESDGASGNLMVGHGLHLLDIHEADGKEPTPAGEPPMADPITIVIGLADGVTRQRLRVRRRHSVIVAGSLVLLEVERTSGRRQMLLDAETGQILRETASPGPENSTLRHDLAGTCRLMRPLVLRGQSLWRWYYHTCFPPCDREGKLYLWLLARHLDCTIFEAARVLPTAVDWRALFLRRYRLEANWRAGRSTRRTVELPLSDQAAWVRCYLLTASAAGCLVYQAQWGECHLFLVENRHATPPLELRFDSVGGGSRVESYSLADKPQYVNMNDRYVVAIAMLVNPDEDVMCVWRWDKKDHGRMLHHWPLPAEKESLIMDMYGRWLLWTSDSGHNHGTSSDSAAQTDERGDHFYIHDLSSAHGHQPRLVLRAESSCVHIQPVRRSGTGQMDDQCISVMLVDTSRPGCMQWEQWELRSLRDDEPSDACPPQQLRRGCIDLGISGRIEYLWTMRLAEEDSGGIYALVMQQAAKWELVLSTREQQVLWIRRAADAPGNLVMGHGLLMIDAYEPMDTKPTPVVLPPTIGHATDEVPRESLAQMADKASGLPGHVSARMQEAQRARAPPADSTTAHATGAHTGNPLSASNIWTQLHQLALLSANASPASQTGPADDDAATLPDQVSSEGDDAPTAEPLPPHPPPPPGFIHGHMHMDPATLGLFGDAILDGVEAMLMDPGAASDQVAFLPPPPATVQRMSILDIHSGRTVHQYPSHAERNSIVVLGPLVLISYRETHLWCTYLLDTQSGRPVRTLRSEENGHGCNFHASATHIPVLTSPRTVVMYDFSDFP
ncbi:hypothetical protein THASP1DRAFT_26525, partial [Thamnocephalis sphaerospora]